MDFPKRAPQQGSPGRSPSAMRSGGATEADENVDPTRPVPAGNQSPLRKKVLGERNGGGGGMEAATPPPQVKHVPTPPTLKGCSAGAYDPKTNYTAPRPEFLRYDPERHREMLLRLARASEVEEGDCSSATSGTAASEAAGSSASSAPGGSESEAELDYSDGEEEEEEVVPAGRGRWARRLLLLLVAVACSCSYIYCMNPTPFPVHSEDGHTFTGPVGGMYGCGVHELDSPRLLGLGALGPLDMSPDDGMEETASPIVQRGSEGAVHLYDQRSSPPNLMAIAMMGLADICPGVQLGESACRFGDENSEDADVLKESSELSEHNAAVMMGTFEEGAQNISSHSIGSTSIQTIDLEASSSRLVDQEEEEDYLNQFVPQLVSREKAIGSSCDQRQDKMCSESVGFDLDSELWPYEQTAKAAKEICHKVKFLWSAMEPRLFGILTCLSVAVLVATIFKYYPRSLKMAVPSSQQMSSKSYKDVPVSMPHQTMQLPVSPPRPLPVPKQNLSGSLEVPTQPMPSAFVSFKDPVQLALPKTDPSVSLRAPIGDHGNRAQKLQKGDAETLKASLGNFQYHRDNDISKPPVVELLGEFTFQDGSRGKSIRNSNQHAGHVSVQESFGEVVHEMPKNSSIFQSPIVGRARKEENAIKEKDATPTPLRRSSRLRNKVTSP